MAFVSQSSRKINEISKTICQLGPGQYFKDQKVDSKRDCAPFQSTSQRRSFLDVKDKQKPGPGNYQVSKPFVQPNIKTVSNSQSIIVKINSTGTSQFKSLVDRFGVRQKQVPGPGNYISQTEELRRSPKSQKGPKYIYDDSVIEKLKKLGTKKNYPAIPERTRGLTDAKRQEVNPEGKLGPAYYQPQKKYHLNSTSTAWGKDKSKRFSLDSKCQVGPGKYNTQYNPIRPEDKVNQPSGHFKSSTVRTYFDSLYYKTNLNQTAKAREQSHYKVKDPAPGQYQTNFSSIKTGQKPFALQFFGSTVERFPEQQTNPTQKPKHKSFYNIRSQIGNNRSFNKSQHAFMSDTSRRPQFLSVNQKDKKPGPGYYRQNVKVQKKLKGNKLQKFGTNSKRIFQEQAPLDELGPGKYYRDQSLQQQNMKNSRFGQVNDISCNFRSTTDRDCFGHKKSQKHPFAEYDVSHYDLSKKIEKQKNFIQNLKKIDVQKAPFESSISRFPHYEQKNKSPTIDNAEQTRKQELKIKQQAQKVRDMVLQANQAQVKQVHKFNFGKTDRFGHNKKNAPPVGSYEVKASWQKKSHNVKYNNK